MSEYENTMELEVNPYDSLVEEKEVPVQSPVIFADAATGEKMIRTNQSVEVIPLPDKTIYSEATVKEYREVCSVEVEIEEDLLVPDIEPDMETILNVQGCPVDISVSDSEGAMYVSGEVKLEILYHSAGSYGEPICMIPSSVSFKKNIEVDCDPADKPEVCVKDIKVEYKIINERKYRIKIILQLMVNVLKDCEHRIFEGIKEIALQMKKEKVNFANIISCKTRESEVREELLINNENVRPVKILKTDFVVSENHRQLTKEKLILNETIWVRVLYMGEVAYRGELCSRPLLYNGKIDHTQFIALSKNESDVVSCRANSHMGKVNVEINRETNGFTVDGDVCTEVCLYNFLEKETVKDFYHLKEDITCDINEETICTGVQTASADYVLRDSVSLTQEMDDAKVIYVDGQVIEQETSLNGNRIDVRGKIRVEVVTIDERDVVVLGRKISSFECSTDLPAGDGYVICGENVFVREMSADAAMDNQVNITAHICAMVNINEEMRLGCIANPCIVRSGEPSKQYPITVYTVKEEDTVWEIAKRFKVSEESIAEINKPENIKAGRKIVIVK